MRFKKFFYQFSLALMIFLFLMYSAPIVESAQRFAVTSEIANVRSGPSTKHTILFTAERGIPFKVIRQKGNWLQIQHSDGDKGWIYKSLVW